VAARGVTPDSVRDVWGGRAVAFAPFGDSASSARPDLVGDRATTAGPWIDAADPTWSADDAVTQLFASQYRPLVRLAALLLHDDGLAEELTQDAFVGLHRAWSRLRDPDKAVAYLRQSVVNRSRSALRHRGVVDRFLRRQGPALTEPSAEAHALAAERQAELLACVRALPARQREALVLRYYADLSEAQTAEAMGISQGAVKSHTARGIAALRRDVERPS
jgi:RNA polymerase sigma-70 factor (sigma-E family)